MNRTQKSITITGRSKHMIDNVTLGIMLHYRFRNGYQKFLIDVVVDVCKYYRNEIHTIPIFNEIIAKVKKYSNVGHGCPYGRDMYVKDAPLVPDMLYNQVHTQLKRRQ